MKAYTCGSCGEKIEPLKKGEECENCGSEQCWEVHAEFPDYDFLFDATGKDRILCYYCYESMSSGYGNALLIHIDGKQYKLVYMDGFGMDFGAVDRDFEPAGVGPVLDFVKAVINGTSLRRIDAWRGIQEAPRGKINGWEEVGSGWHSSMEGSDFVDAVNECSCGKHGDFAIVFERGSNVCSQPMTLYAPKSNLERIKAALRGKEAAPSYAGITILD